jgi:thiamine-monophosphate kinase
MQATGEVGVAASPIGTIMAGTSSPKFLDAEGRELPLRRTSYSHF